MRLRLRGETHDDMHRTRESALAFIAGKNVAEIVALGEEIYDEEMSDRIWSGTLALAQASPRRAVSGSGWSPRHRSSWRRSSPGACS